MVKKIWYNPLMKKSAIILGLLLLAAGLPAEAAVVPVCPMMVQGMTTSCCPTGSCDCSINASSRDLLKVAPMADLRLELSASASPEVSVQTVQESGRFIQEIEDPPPQESPLYDLYSNYRI